MSAAISGISIQTNSSYNGVRSKPQSESRIISAYRAKDLPIAPLGGLWPVKEGVISKNSPCGSEARKVQGQDPFQYMPHEPTVLNHKGIVSRYAHCYEGVPPLSKSFLLGFFS